MARREALFFSGRDFTREVRVAPSGSDLGKGQRRERGPHGHDSVYLTFPPHSTTSTLIGPRWGRKSFCAVAQSACRIPSSATGAVASRPMMSTTIGFGDSSRRLQPLRQDVHVPATLLSAVRLLQPDCPQSGQALRRYFLEGCSWETAAPVVKSKIPIT